MTQRGMSYEHPAYQARIAAGSATVAGNAAVSNRFAAFTAMKLKSVQFTAAVAGTSAGHTVAVSKVSGTDTTGITTATLGTSAIGVATNIDVSAVAAATLVQGDQLVCKNGTDATGLAAVPYELAVTPGAGVSV